MHGGCITLIKAQKEEAYWPCETRITVIKKNNHSGHRNLTYFLPYKISVSRYFKQIVTSGWVGSNWHYHENIRVQLIKKSCNDVVGSTSFTSVEVEIRFMDQGEGAVVYMVP